MRSIRITAILVTLVAATAMSAIASAAASAAVPLLPLLLSKTNGSLVKTSFKGTSGASSFETKSGESVKCKADTITGKITGLSTDEAEIKFTGCTAVGGLLKCKTTGAAAGEIVLKVTSLLVWISVAKEEPGEDDILPSAGLTIECTGLASETLHVRGSTICPSTKTLSVKATITCTATKGVQAPTEYEMEGGVKVKDITETEGTGTKKFAFEQSGLTGTDSLEFEEEVQIT
jgi:hypothetical protein